MEKINPTAAITGWPSGVWGWISVEDSMHEPINSTQANTASTTFLVVSLRLFRISP